MVESVLIIFALLLLGAKVLEFVAESIGFPPLLGQILAGILLGPVLGFVAIQNGILDFLSIAIIFVLFLAGLEVKSNDLQERLYESSAVAFGADILSLAMGFALGYFLLHSVIAGLAIGVIIISTSNDSLFSLLLKTGKLKTTIGKFIVSTNIADDVIGVLSISFFTMYVVYSHVIVTDLAKLFLISIGIYLFVLTVGSKINRAILNFVSTLKDEQLFLAVPVVIAFLLSYVTQNVGLSIAAGAFLAGTTMSNTSFTESIIKPKVETLANSFFVPLFYAAIGSILVMTNLNLSILIGVLVVSIFGKYIGAYVSSFLIGFKHEDSHLLGICMIPRGNDNIIIAQIVLSLGVISLSIYSSVIFALIGTTILTPLLMKLAERR
ncbi:MAG: cation:proton antiporter [Candidatus Aenigmarchaeota archaeon]|nr:cation:proton antiporter [Candidatus Aenigmarchaeota archaeon]